MNVSLPEAMEEFVRQKVAAGDYETASEVVREGLRLLKQSDESGKPVSKARSKRAWIRFGPDGASPPNRLKLKWLHSKRSGRRIAALNERLRTVAKGRKGAP